MSTASSITWLLFGAISSASIACANGNADAPPAPPPPPAATAASTAPAAAVAEASQQFNPRLLRRFAPARKRIDGEGPAPTSDQIALGRQLWYDKRLSKNENQACQSCHKLEEYGMDGLATSVGGSGQRGGRNAPTVYHSAGAFSQFWDGRAGNVEEQAKGPILNPIEMGMPSGDAVVARLKRIPGYVEGFVKAFPGEKQPVTYDNVGRAIGAFERGLTTRSRWDDYLEGKTAALSAPELEGLKVFTNVGCMVCHTGELIGGSSYQRVGAVEPWPNQADHGRAAVTKNPGDGMMFKVPTLRNVAKTAPYFHDGSTKTLDEAVRLMGKHQLGLDLSDPEVVAIATWLNSLTGDLPTEYIAPPELPGLAAAVAHK